MARLISAPSGSIFGKGLFGTASQATINYLQSNIESFASFGGDYAQKIYERSKVVFNAINSDAAVMAAEAVLSQAESMMGLDIIEPLLTLEQLRTAQPLMQQWIMTDPTIRKAFYAGKIEGYSDTYDDPEPGLIGHEQAAYRLLMNGVLVPHEEASHQYSLYYDRESDKDKLLTIRKLSAIVDSQEAARNALEEGEHDPTSQYGASL